jgi:hypothetical protein
LKNRIQKLKIKMTKSSVQIDKLVILKAFFTILHDSCLGIHLLYIAVVVKLMSTRYYTMQRDKLILGMGKNDFFSPR